MLAQAKAEVPLPAARVWQLAKKTATQLYLSRSGFNYAAELPAVRDEGYEGEYRIRLLGFFPAWTHRQRFDRVDDASYEILVRESGGPYRVWDHSMRIEQVGPTQCVFIDTIEVEAGFLTPLVWLAARLLCRSRMRRLVELARVLA